MIHIVNCVNDKYYYEKMGPWLEKTALLGPEVAVHVVTIDFTISEEQKSKYPNIDYRYVDKKNCPTINSNWCIQEGGWIQCMSEFPDTDTFVCIDGDCLIQRDFSDSEKKVLSQWPDDVVGMNWNAGEGDTLSAEANRIFPTVPSFTIQSHWYPNNELFCFNAGVIVANFKTWKVFYNTYLENLDRVKKYFNHIAHQQWLINWVAQTSPLSVELLPQTFHTHGHYGLYPGAMVESNGDVSFSGVKSWVRHKINWEPYPA